MIGVVDWTAHAEDFDDEKCARETCDNDADGLAKYEFPEYRGGAATFSYCAECAQYMHDRFTIDHVVSGDLGIGV